jgi:hypothetical protein
MVMMLGLIVPMRMALADCPNPIPRPNLVPINPPTQAAGDHSHTLEVNGGGDQETRPKNVALYFYVKIN